MTSDKSTLDRMIYDLVNSYTIVALFTLSQDDKYNHSHSEMSPSRLQILLTINRRRDTINFDGLHLRRGRNVQ